MNQIIHLYYWGDVNYANMTNLNFFDDRQFSQGFPLNQSSDLRHTLKYILKVK